MAPKIFLTGATGYIGGDALHEIVTSHPDWEITALVRNSDKGAKVAQVYPKVKLVYGDLDSAELIEEEASKADIIYHFANCDHLASAEAISRGLARSSTPTPSFWIHTSGALILAHESQAANAHGTTFAKLHNDYDRVAELTSLPDTAAHRPVDKVVLAASPSAPDPSRVKTAIVCPPIIWGKGRGPDNTRSVQAYEAARVMLTTKRGFVIGKGENRWHEVHVEDLSRLFVMLGEAAVAGGAGATWNEEGYYLVEDGEVVWGELLREIAAEVERRGFLDGEVRTVSGQEADELRKGFAAMLGTDSRGEAVRARKVLGWKPSGRKIKDDIKGIVDEEARALGLVKSHAEKVVE